MYTELGCVGGEVREWGREREQQREREDLLD